MVVSQNEMKFSGTHPSRCRVYDHEHGGHDRKEKINSHCELSIARALTTAGSVSCGSIASLVLGQFASDACGTTSEKQKIGFLRLIESIKIANLANHIKRVCPVGHRFVLILGEDIAFAPCFSLTSRREWLRGQVDFAAPESSHNMIFNRIRRDSRRAPMRDRMGWGLPSVFYSQFRAGLATGREILDHGSVDHQVSAQLSLGSVCGEDHRLPGRMGGCLGGVCRKSGIVEGLPHVAQLNPGQADLTNDGTKQSESKNPKPKRVDGNLPCRFRQFFINLRFLTAFSLLFLDLLCAPLAGKYFYRKRRLVGAYRATTD
jgi:hypothetical protein